MADFQLTMTLDGRQGNKNAVVAVNVIAPPVGSEIQCIIKDTVDVSRQVEIIDGWKWLYQGLAERNVLEEFAGNVVYTSVPLNRAGEGVARKTSSDPVIMVDGDIALALAVGLVTPDGTTVSLGASFTQLRDFAKEFGVLKVA